MARAFDGVNDRLETANDAVAGLDNQLMSFGFPITVANSPGTLALFLLSQSQGSTIRLRVQAVNPLVSGWRLDVAYVWSGGNGSWTSADITGGVPHHIVLTYDRGDTANDPVMYVDGVSVTVTENSTPAGTAQTGGDTLRIGESIGGTLDLTATLGNFAAQGGVLWDAAMVNRARWWGRPGGGLHVYYPFWTDKLTNEGSNSATLTASGTTVAALQVPVVRPGSALGW